MNVPARRIASPKKNTNPCLLLKKPPLGDSFLLEQEEITWGLFHVQRSGSIGADSRPPEKVDSRALDLLRRDGFNQKSPNRLLAEVNRY